MEVCLNSIEIPDGAQAKVNNGVISLIKRFDIELGDFITDGDSIIQLEDVDGAVFEYHTRYNYDTPDHFSDTPYMQTLLVRPSSNWRRLTESELNNFRKILSKFGRALHDNNIVHVSNHWWIKNGVVTKVTPDEYFKLLDLGINVYDSFEDAVNDEL